MPHDDDLKTSASDAADSVKQAAARASDTLDAAKEQVRDYAARGVEYAAIIPESSPSSSSVNRGWRWAVRLSLAMSRPSCCGADRDNSKLVYSAAAPGIVLDATVTQIDAIDGATYEKPSGYCWIPLARGAPISGSFNSERSHSPAHPIALKLCSSWAGGVRSRVVGSLQEARSYR